MTETCPKCGRNLMDRRLDGFTRFVCGSWIDRGNFHQGALCLELLERAFPIINEIAKGITTHYQNRQTAKFGQRTYSRNLPGHREGDKVVSSMPECTQCDNILLSGPCLCPSCSLASQAEAQALRERVVMAMELLRKSTAVIDDMRETDRYNSRVDFDVNGHLADLERFLTNAQDLGLVVVQKEDLEEVLFHAEIDISTYNEFCRLKAALSPHPKETP